ncbi:MAG: hypothetical protein ABR552_02885 [Actinomycetota bacterium]|nr:hypothetical protein [Actinomycetota bacterium]
MSEEIFCECGVVLVDGVSDAGVRPIGSNEWLPFRRTTDYVMCERCLRSYGVRELLARTEDVAVISLLERMADRAERDGPKH